MALWPHKAAVCTPPWPSDTLVFDLLLYKDDRRAETKHAAAMNIELIEQMLFLSKNVELKWKTLSVHIKCDNLIHIVVEVQHYKLNVLMAS